MKEVRKLEGGRVRIRKRSRCVEEMATIDGPKCSDVYHSAVISLSPKGMDGQLN